MSKGIKYKETNLTWCTQIPENWLIKKLKYVAMVQPSNVDKKTDEKEIPIRLCNYIDVYKNDFITEDIAFMKASAKEDEIEKFKIKIGDVLITKDSETPTDIAVAALVKTESEDLICGYHLAQIRANTNEITGEYIFRVFQSREFNTNFEIAANGITRYGLGIEAIKSVSIPIPPISIQQAISNYLDQKTSKIDTLISKKQKLIDYLKEERLGIITRATTKGINENSDTKLSQNVWLNNIPKNWTEKRLKVLTGYFKGFAFKSSDFSEAGIPLIKATNIKNWQIENVKEFIDITNQKPEFEKVRLKKGDIIISTVGSKPDVINSVVGQLALINVEFANSYLNQNTVCLRPTNEIDQGYLKFSLLSNYFRSNLNALCAWIANQAYLEVEDILNISIPIPNSLKEQISIVEYINDKLQNISKSILRIEQEIALIKEYKASLINDVVTGKIILT